MTVILSTYLVLLCLCYCYSDSTTSTTPFCGNGVVEEGEECDCGFNDDECRQRQDSCCYPRFLENDVLNPKSCKRMIGALCSPSEGPCCSRDCKFKPTNSYTCRQPSDCSNAQTCNGASAQCPPSDPKPDRESCQENTNTNNASL